MNKELLNVFNLFISLNKIKDQKIEITKDEMKLIKNSYPGRKYCNHIKWFRYVIYNHIENVQTIEVTIEDCLKKLKEYNGRNN